MYSQEKRRKAEKRKREEVKRRKAEEAAAKAPRLGYPRTFAPLSETYCSHRIMRLRELGVPRNAALSSHGPATLLSPWRRPCAVAAPGVLLLNTSFLAGR